MEKRYYTDEGILSKGACLMVQDETDSKYFLLIPTTTLPATAGAPATVEKTVLTDNVEFEALKERKAEMTVKEIEGECAILYARKNLAQTNFSKSNDGVMAAGLIDNAGKEGFVETKYGYIPVRH